MILTIIIIIINFNDCELSTLVTKNVSLFNDDNLDVLYLSKDSSNRKLFHNNNNDSMIPTNLNENFQDFSITFEKNQLKKQRQQQPQQQQQQSQFLYDDNIKEESSVPYTAALAPKTNFLSKSNIIDKESKIVSLNNSRTYVPVSLTENGDEDDDGDDIVQPAPVFIPTSTTTTKLNDFKSTTSPSPSVSVAMKPRRKKKKKRQQKISNNNNGTLSSSSSKHKHGRRRTTKPPPPPPTTSVLQLSSTLSLDNFVGHQSFPSTLSDYKNQSIKNPIVENNYIPSMDTLPLSSAMILNHHHTNIRKAKNNQTITMIKPKDPESSIDIDYMDNTDVDDNLMMRNNHSNRNNNHYVSSLVDDNDYLMMLSAESQRIETVAKPERSKMISDATTSYSPQNIDIKSIFGNYKSPELTIDPFKLYEDASKADAKNNGAIDVTTTADERSKYSKIVNQIFDDKDGVDRVIVERRPVSSSLPSSSSSSVKDLDNFQVIYASGVNNNNKDKSGKNSPFTSSYDNHRTIIATTTTIIDPKNNPVVNTRRYKKKKLKNNNPLSFYYSTNDDDDDNSHNNFESIDHHDEALNPIYPLHNNPGNHHHHHRHHHHNHNHNDNGNV
nr:putative uncharacterized protein DDB_G0282129 [Dermatophagoides farinae]